MKKFFSKLNSRKLATTIGAWALGISLIDQTEGPAESQPSQRE